MNDLPAEQDFQNARGRQEERAQLKTLQESERRLAEAQRIAGIGSWSWDPLANTIAWSEELFRLFGLERGVRTGPTFDEYLERLTPASKPVLLAHVNAALNDGVGYDFEHDVVRPDGTMLRVRSAGGPVRDENGNVIRLVGIAQDVSRQWALQEQIRKSEARYALAVDGTSDGIWTYDIALRQTEVSPRVRELVDLPPDMEWVAEASAEKLLSPVEMERLRQAVRMHLEQHAPLDIELPFLAGARGERWFRVRGRAVRDASGIPTLLAGSISDVTEQRALQARLQHDSKMTALGTLAGGIAHDFNNLVAAMLGYAQLAADELPIESPAAVHVDQVISAARRAREIVRELLAFSRPEEPRRTAVDVSQVVEESVRQLRPSLPLDVDVSVSGLEAPHLVHGDETQLQRVVLNLCLNSVHAVRQRAGRIEIRVDEERFDLAAASARGLTPGVFVRVRVIDNGVGIKAEVLERVFDPFYSTKPVGEGTGLGLSVVHGIVVASGGAVSIDTVEGTGTNVVIWLPRLDVPAPAGLPSTASDPLYTGASVVVVDDDQAVGRLLRVALQRAQFQVHLFASPVAAYEALSNGRVPCDCIISDYSMPQWNGVEFISRLRAAGVYAPAIIVTGFASATLNHDRRSVGIASVLDKPIELKSFIDEVRRVLAEPAATVA